jgi:hypothetical protein
VEAISAEQVTTPGDTVHVTATLVNRSAAPIRIESITAPGLSGAVTPADLKNNEPWTGRITATIPASAPLSQPYWLASPSTGGTYDVCDEAMEPEEAAHLLEELRHFPEIRLKGYNDAPVVHEHIRVNVALSRAQWRDEAIS